MYNLLDQLKPELLILDYNTPSRMITTKVSFHEQEITKSLKTNTLFNSKKLSDITGRFDFVKKSNNDFVKDISRIIEKKMYVDVLRLLEPNVDLYYEACLNEKMQDCFNNIVNGVREILSENYIEEVIQEYICEAGETQTLEIIQEVKRNIAYNVLTDTIPKYLRKEVPKCAYLKRNETEYTLLHLACEAGNLDLVKNLIEFGWDVNLAPSLFEIVKNQINKNYPEVLLESAEKLSADSAIKLEKYQAYKSIIDYLSIPIVKIPKYGRGCIGMIGLMGAATTPAKKVIISGAVGFSVIDEYDLKANVRHSVIKETEAGVFLTPGGSDVYSTWDILIDKDKGREKAKGVTVFLDGEKAPKSTDIEKPIYLKTNLPVNVPKNSKLKKVEIVTVTPITNERLVFWDKQNRKIKRYRSQIETMGKYSASEMARLAGFNVTKKKSWQWCHIIAFSIGGEDGQYPKSIMEYESIGPQRESNLVVGTVEANAQMLLVEDVVKKLVLKTTKPIYIRVKPTFVKGLEEYHIAETLEYTIQDAEKNPDCQITFSFNMLSRRKTALQEPEVIGPILEHLFLDKTKVNELVNSPNSAPSPMIFSSPLPNEKQFPQSSQFSGVDLSEREVSDKLFVAARQEDDSYSQAFEKFSLNEMSPTPEAFNNDNSSPVNTPLYSIKRNPKVKKSDDTNDKSPLFPRPRPGAPESDSE